MKKLNAFWISATLFLLFGFCLPQKAEAQIYCPQSIFGQQGRTPSAGEWWVCINYLQNGVNSTSSLTSLPNAEIFVGSPSGKPQPQAVSGDASLANTGALTVTKTSGVPFGTAATVNTGTIGATVPLNNGGFTQSGLANFTGGIQINGTGVTLPLSAANGGTGESGTITGALKGNGTSPVTQAACGDLTNAGTACPVNIGTSGGTLGLLNANKTDSGNNTFSGTDNFTGTIKIGGTAVTLPVPVAIGGTTSTNASDALQTFSGVLNASACGYTQTPSWCSGSDVGSWINAAISYANGLGWVKPKIILDPTSTYNQSTQITKPMNIALDCQGSNLIWQSNSGVAFALNGGSLWNIGGLYNCILSTSGGWSTGHTNIAFYSGGDPAGVISPVDALDANDILYNVQITGFKYGFTHGNNSWANNIVLPLAHANWDGIYGVPVLFGAVTSFSITSNVVTVTVNNSFSIGDTINITGLSVGTYLNKVPLVIVSVSGTQFTASFTHANVSSTSDSGQAYDGFYNAGEPSIVTGGSLSNNSNCGMELNYNPDEWHVQGGTHFDYNTNYAVCGGAPNVQMKDYYAEQFQAPLIAHTASTGTATFKLYGGQLTATGTGTDTGIFLLANSSDRLYTYGVTVNSNHATTDLIRTGGLSGLSICSIGIDYSSGSTQPSNLTDATSAACKNSGGFLVTASGIIPYQGETFAVVGEHLDAPSLPTTNYFCNQISYISRTDIAPNAQWCIYHGAGGGDTDKFALGMLGRNGVLTMDANGVIGFGNSNLSASSGLYLDSSKNLTNTAPSITGGTVVGNPSGSSASPSATSAPILGIPGTTGGALGLANGGISGATTTLQPSAVTSNNTVSAPWATGTLSEASACSIASASTIDLGAISNGCSPGAIITVTGSTGINNFGSSAPVGVRYTLMFTGAPTITNSGTLNMMGNVSWTAAAGWGLECFEPSVAGTWNCEIGYNPAVQYSTGGSVQTTGAFTGARLQVSGTATATNGLDQPATNTVEFRTNSLAAGRIDASQRLLWGYTADQGGGELLQVNSGGFFNGKVTATNMLDSALSASSIVWSDGSKNFTSTAASQAQNTFYAAPSGSSGVPTFRTIASGDLPGFLYNTSGTIQTSPHMVTGTATLSAGSVTVTLSGAAVYTSSGSYACSGNDTGGSAIATSTQNQSASSFKIFGTLTDTVSFSCIGN